MDVARFVSSDCLELALNLDESRDSMPGSLGTGTGLSRDRRINRGHQKSPLNNKARLAFCICAQAVSFAYCPAF